MGAPATSQVQRQLGVPHRLPESALRNILGAQVPLNLAQNSLQRVAIELLSKSNGDLTLI